MEQSAPVPLLVGHWKHSSDTNKEWGNDLFAPKTFLMAREGFIKMPNDPVTHSVSKSNNCTIFVFVDDGRTASVILAILLLWQAFFNDDVPPHFSGIL